MVQSSLNDSNKNSLYLGIDTGSVSIHHVLINQDGYIVNFGNVQHYGNICTEINHQLNQFDFSQNQQISFDKRAEDIIKTGKQINE